MKRSDKSRTAIARVYRTMRLPQQARSTRVFFAIILIIQSVAVGCKNTQSRESAAVSNPFDSIGLQSALEAFESYQPPVTSAEWGLISITHDHYANYFEVVGRYGKDGVTTLSRVSLRADGSVIDESEEVSSFENKDVYVFYKTIAQEMLALRFTVPPATKNEVDVIVIQVGSEQCSYSIASSIGPPSFYFDHHENSDKYLEGESAKIEEMAVYHEFSKAPTLREGVLPGMVEVVLRGADKRLSENE